MKPCPWLSQRLQRKFRPCRRAAASGNSAVFWSSLTTLGLFGVNSVTESLSGFDLANNASLDRSDRWSRGLMGGGQLGLSIAGASSFRLTTQAGFTESDVFAAINRLEQRGILPADGNKPIFPAQVVELANIMNSGLFNRNLWRLTGDVPLIDKASNSIISGHHRIIANEMTDFGLHIEYLNATTPPLIVPGAWDEIVPFPGLKPR